MANQTSMVGNQHLLDTLLFLGVNVIKIFSPEHGFRGTEADGKHIADMIDEKSGLPVLSLYGNNKKPTPSQLENIDIVVFDIQDVGVRFYTYISSLHYIMEACAESGKELLVLDRPNPNGNYIDGPVLQEGFESFVGMHPVPVVHGMTIAEYAGMINGEGWLKDQNQCRLSSIICKNYSHEAVYILPVPPSPNLPNMQAIRLYPSLAFFEGTIVSEGRGTDFPFQVYGFPDYSGEDFEFTPRSIKGFSVHPKFENLVCRGRDLREFTPSSGVWDRLYLDWLIESYEQYTDKEKFFTPYFDKLAGTDQLRKDIQSGIPLDEIRLKWDSGLSEFKVLRKKYLLYE